MSPRNLLRDQELRDERSNHILNTALKLFAQRGLAATKISDIAKNAGLSHGLIYNYFTSKEEIYKILVLKSLGCLKQESEAALALSVDPWEKLTSITELALFNKDSNLAGDYMMLELQIQNLESIPKELKEDVKKTRDEKISPVAAIFSEGQATGCFIDGDPRELALFYFSLLKGISASEDRSSDGFSATIGRNMQELFRRK